MQTNITTNVQPKRERILRFEDEEEGVSHIHEREFIVEEELRKIDGELTPAIKKTLEEKWTREGFSDDDLRVMLDHLKRFLPNS